MISHRLAWPVRSLSACFMRLTHPAIEQGRCHVDYLRKINKMKGRGCPLCNANCIAPDEKCWPAGRLGRTVMRKLQFFAVFGFLTVAGWATAVPGLLAQELRTPMPTPPARTTRPPTRLQK